MKNLIILAILLIGGSAICQQISPKLEAVGELVKATYYFDNGQVQQQGYFKDGKPDGKWTAFDQEGSKISVGSYVNGIKTGKWKFYHGTNLSEVDYSENRIAAVRTASRDALVDRN